MITAQWKNEYSKYTWQPMVSTPKEGFASLDEACEFLNRELPKWVHGTELRLMIHEKYLENGLLVEIDAPYGKWSI